MSEEAETPETESVEEGMLLDYITNEQVKDTPKEKVRQRIARALFHEYGISVEDMVPDYKVLIDGRRKAIDIAIFEAGSDKSDPKNLRRMVICDKEPKLGTKGAYKMRDADQAKKELGPLYDAMTAVESCRFGLWTNGLEFFFFAKREGRFQPEFTALGDWPLADESLGSRTVASNAQLRRADRAMLLTTFRRCHNYIHGNEGMPKDVAFWQFLYLIFAKMHDERLQRENRDHPRRFWAGMFEKTVNGKKQLVDEQFDTEGQKAIRARIEPLFAEARKQYEGTIFRGNEQITLSDRALAFMVAELARYDFGRTDLDAKGAAYQELVGTNLRGDRGQYFTPRGPIDLMVAMLDPKPHERVLDPACGTGGFLVSTLKHLDRRFHEEAKVPVGEEPTDDFLSIRDRLSSFARENLFGADFDLFLVRAAQMNVVMASNAQARLFNMDSLEFPAGQLPGVGPARTAVGLGSIDVILTNPPFGTDIKVMRPDVLQHYDLGHTWKPTGDGGFYKTPEVEAREPEVLFIERCVDWLKPGGRMGIVLPDGVLGNPKDEFIRWWILRHCWVLASVDLPVEVFVVEANVNILTSLLFLKKKSVEEIRAEDLGKKVDYPVFMAVAEKVGFDRRGNTLYERAPDGEDLVVEVEHRERVRIGGQSVLRTLRRKEKTLDDDLPKIAKEYAWFRAQNPEPGT